MLETEFHEIVEEWLSQYFSNIHREVTLPSGRRVDFLVETPWESYAIEVENTTDDLYDGIGQAITYACESGYTPVVIMPKDGGEPDLRSLGMFSDEMTPEIELISTEQ